MSKYTKYIRKYLGCTKQTAKKFAEKYSEMKFEDLIPFLYEMKMEINKIGKSENNKMFKEERMVKKYGVSEHKR